MDEIVTWLDFEQYAFDQKWRRERQKELIEHIANQNDKKKIKNKRKKA